MNNILEDVLRSFIESEEYNKAEYYMIRHCPNFTNYCTLLKVESEDYIKNISDFIKDHIGNVQSVYNVGDRLDFTVDNEVYSLFNYDGGLVRV